MLSPDFDSWLNSTDEAAGGCNAECNAFTGISNVVGSRRSAFYISFQLCAISLKHEDMNENKTLSWKIRATGGRNDNTRTLK